MIKFSIQTLNIIPIRKIRKWNWSKDYKKIWKYSFWNVFWLYRQKNRCRRRRNAYYRANGYSPNLFIKLRIFVSKMIVSKCVSTAHTCSREGSIFAMPLGPAPLSLKNFLYLALKRVQTLNIIPIRKIRKWNWSKDY